MADISDMLQDFIEDNGIATSDEIKLVGGINGFTHEAMMKIIYVRTGFRSIEQCKIEGYRVPHNLLELARKYGI